MSIWILVAGAMGVALASRSGNAPPGAMSLVVAGDDGAQFTPVPVKCAGCNLQTMAYVIRAETGGRVEHWIKVPPFWDVAMRDPNVVDQLLGRCPEHAFGIPKTESGAGGEVRSTPDGAAWIVPPGWYWGWVGPTEWKLFDRMRKQDRNKVFRVRKSFGGHVRNVGTVYVFEVVNHYMIWTLRGRPTPAPNQLDTDMDELLGGAPERSWPEEFAAYLRWLMKKDWR